MEIGKTYRLNDHGAIAFRYHGEVVLITRIEEPSVRNDNRGRVWFNFPEHRDWDEKCFKIDKWNDYVVGKHNPTKWEGNVLKFKFI